jgi:hypothetical protein
VPATGFDAADCAGSDLAKAVRGVGQLGTDADGQFRGRRQRPFDLRLKQRTGEPAGRFVDVRPAGIDP